MGKVIFREQQELGVWRKIAFGSWWDAGDPSVYAILKIDCTNFLERRKNLHQKDPQKKPPTFTALVGRALALTLSHYPQLNGMIRLGSISMRENVNIFFQVPADAEGKDLSGLIIEAAETKSLDTIMEEIATKSQKVKAGADEEFKNAKKQFQMIPPWAMKWVLRFTSFLIYTLNLDLSVFGIPKDPFGSAMITSVGMLDVDTVFAPLVPYTRVPLLIAVCTIKDEACAHEGKVVVRQKANLCITLDHRLIDGLYGSKMMKMMRHLLETEEGLDEMGMN